MKPFLNGVCSLIKPIYTLPEIISSVFCRIKSCHIQTAGSPNIIIEEASYIKPGKTRKRRRIRRLTQKQTICVLMYVDRHRK